MKIEELARQVFIQRSMLLKNCWYLCDLEDFDRIFYSFGNECLLLALELQKQIVKNFNHPVSVESLSLQLRFKQRDDVDFVSDFDRESSLSKLLTEANQAKTLFVCDEEFCSYLERMDHFVFTSLRICTPQIFYLGLFDKNTEQQYFCSNSFIASARILKPVSYIAVLSSSAEGWYQACRLYERYSQDRPSQVIDFLFVSDGCNHAYEEAARYHFLKLVENIGVPYIQFIKLQDLSNSDLNGRCLWVLPQMKSYLTVMFPQDYYYVFKSHEKQLWGIFSIVGKEVVLQDIECLAKMKNISGNDANTVCQAFLDNYHPMAFSDFRWRWYWFRKRLAQFFMF